MAVSAEQLLSVPDDGMRRELVRGELRVMTPPGADHGLVAAEVGRVLGNHVNEHRLGRVLAAESGFVLERDPDTVRAPDAAFVSRTRLAALGRTSKYWPEAPAFAVEVVSPSDSFHEVEAKALGWLAAGSVAVLVLDPERRSGTIYRAGGEVRVHLGDAVLDLDDAVPGLRLELAGLFE
ncbi:MAG: Uma2 family endonuclease [Solirubrobacteraceae bacterium]|jgi:Uma2 family endonuclease